jgi:hypothetical protein
MMLVVATTAICSPVAAVVDPAGAEEDATTPTLDEAAADADGDPLDTVGALLHAPNIDTTNNTTIKRPILLVTTILCPY